MPPRAHSPGMDLRLLLAAALLLPLAGCDRFARPAEKVEYRPGEAGTVDHALCLLGFTAVPLKHLQTGHHLVEARLNGKDGTFILDTGANASVVDTAHAEHFGLTGGVTLPAAAVGLGGSMKARQVTIDSLEIGGVALRNRRVMTSDLSSLAGLLGRLSTSTIHGIIGQDVMKEHRAVIDVERPILYLIEADRAPAPVPAERCRGSDEEKAPDKKH